MRKERLELSRVSPLAPKASASTNSATFAMNGLHQRGAGPMRLGIPASPFRRDTAGLVSQGEWEVVGRQGFEPWTY